MKLTLLSLVSLLSGAAAFAPSTSKSVPTALASGKSDLEALATKLNPVVKYFDPLELADEEFWDLDNDATIGWLRQSEIKHGRIAMFAFVGYIVQSNFVLPYPQYLNGELPPSVDLTPEAQWDAVPEMAKWQIFILIAFLEWWDECGGGGVLPHYTKGRQPGKYPSLEVFREKVHFALDLYDPFGFNKKMTDEVKERRLVAEINNGRLAMLGIFGFLCANKIPGSVPLLEQFGAAPGYEGDPMVPFEGQFSYFS